MRTRAALLLALVLAISACSEEADAGAGGGPSTGPVAIEGVEFVLLGSDPVEAQVVIHGTLPTPCHALVVDQLEPLLIDLASTFGPDEVCADVLQPFRQTISLGAPGNGDHVLVVNGAEYPFAVGVENGPTVSDTAFVDGVTFTFLESYPVRVRATITGSVPTPCHAAVVTETTRDGERVLVQIGSEAPADQMCATVLEPFELTVDVGSFETGEQVAVVNGTEYPFVISGAADT